MRARAPGKVVLSGAYAVLEGAPAIVAAVDRYVIADTDRRAEFDAPEVAAALSTAPFEGARAPFFDSSALRENGSKLGLGSSAAIVAASLAALALETDPTLDPDALVARVLEPALIAHRKAQGGGSGIDVLTACVGGVVLARKGRSSDIPPSSRGGDSDSVQGLCHSQIRIPDGVHLRLLASSKAAVTSSLLAQIRAFAERAPGRATGLMARQAEASFEAADAAQANNSSAFVAALEGQSHALAALGTAAGAPIVTNELTELASRVGSAAAVLPAGAGGGDVAIWASCSPPSTELERIAIDCKHRILRCKFGATGVERVREES
jgi:phosphomevalonate kinase